MTTTKPPQEPPAQSPSVEIRSIGPLRALAPFQKGKAGTEGKLDMTATSPPAWLEPDGDLYESPGFPRPPQLEGVDETWEEREVRDLGYTHPNGCRFVVVTKDATGERYTYHATLEEAQCAPPAPRDAIHDALDRCRTR